MKRILPLLLILAPKAAFAQPGHGNRRTTP